MATTSEQKQRLFCGQCGQENPTNHRFCSGCGSAITPLTAGTATVDHGVLDRTQAENAAVAAATTIPSLSNVPQVSSATQQVPAAQVVPPPPASRVPVPPPPGETSAAKQVVESQPPPAGPILTGIALERERDRLLTLVNVQRMRGQTGEARKTLEQILVLCEGMPPRQLAPNQEMIGDLFAADEKWDAALEAFKKAKELDPTRTSAERKFAELTLRISDIKAEKRLADAMMRGEDIGNLLTTNALATDRGRRNAGVAMLLSTVIPGFGQFYNGELVKGGIVIGIYALTLLYFALSPDHDLFMRKFLAIVTVHSKYANAPVSPLSIVAGIVLVGDWLYSIVDAPFIAAKTPKSAAGPTIDKTGWEV